MTRSRRVQLALDLWLAYREASRPIPPTWAARACGASPTAVLAALRAEALITEVRRGHDGRDWNWARRSSGRILGGMKNTVSNGHPLGVSPVSAETFVVISNGTRFETGGAPEQEPGVDEGLLDFATAIAMAADGWAVAREADCSRVVFFDAGGLRVGTQDDAGVCSPSGMYCPVDADTQARDWVIMAVEAT